VNRGHLVPLSSATIRVFDGLTIEIGNGSGTVIGLSRQLRSGEVIAVVQELGSCTFDQAFSIAVH
jgi:hypothetical protein